MRLSQMMGAAPRWISGVVYPVDALAWSPISYHTYRRTVAGAGVTDPSADKTNWRLFGPGGIKSVQRGVTYTGTTYGARVSVTISPVNLASSVVTLLGFRSTPPSHEANSPFQASAATNLELMNASTLQIVRGPAGSSGTLNTGEVVVSWQIVEYWS